MSGRGIPGPIGEVSAALRRTVTAGLGVFVLWACALLPDARFVRQRSIYRRVQLHEAGVNVGKGVTSRLASDIRLDVGKPSKVLGEEVAPGLMPHKVTVYPILCSVPPWAWNSIQP